MQHYQLYRGSLLIHFIKHDSKATWQAEGYQATHHSFPHDPHGPVGLNMPLTPRLSPWKHLRVSHPYGWGERVKRFGSDEVTKTTVVQIFQTRATKISVQGIHGLVCEWDTCLNNNEDSLIWTLNHWTTQMCLIRFWSMKCM
jgi:hypothetical protein